jgi:quercetin dioxygenase-like cupin family protein
MSTPAEQEVPGITRIDLQEHDLSVPGRQAVQNRVQISPEAPAFRHFHYGEEVIYVLEGELEYQIDGQPPRNVQAGDALTVPAETIHSVTGDGAELATYFVEKGKPLITLAE